ncbi:MAG: methyltransferase domain-containing protein [Anaerolineae bacterium]|jgi:SAM-dependent methyltransferase
MTGYRDQLTTTWKRKEQQPFTGWDFSYLDGRMFEEQPPWSYMSLAAARMRQALSLLDMGTGGGERLLELQEHWPGKVVATEDYAPNVKLATERLAPLGVQVKEASLLAHGPMPFADGEFELVLNRHSGFNPVEVARVLTPGGVFLTQQVHGLWAHDLLAAFDARPQWPEATLENNVPKLQAAGLTIVTAKQWSGELSFSDVGAVVYYLRAIPWLVHGFTVETHLDYLLELQSKSKAGEKLAFEARKYLIEAQR